MCYETAIRFLRLLKEHETFPAAACVARFWARPPKYVFTASQMRVSDWLWWRRRRSSVDAMLRRYQTWVGGIWQQPLNRATPYVAAAGHSPSSAMGRTAVPPTPLHRTSVSPRALSGTLSFRRRVFAVNPHHRKGFSVTQAAPPKSIMSTVLPNTPFPKSKKRMLGRWGVPEAGIKARIMSISRVFGGRKASRQTS